MFAQLLKFFSNQVVCQIKLDNRLDEHQLKCTYTQTPHFAVYRGSKILQSTGWEKNAKLRLRITKNYGVIVTNFWVIRHKNHSRMGQKFEFLKLLAIKHCKVLGLSYKNLTVYCSRSGHVTTYELTLIDIAPEILKCQSVFL